MPPRWVSDLLAGLRAVAQQYPGTISEVRGKGLLIGVEFSDRDIAALVIAGLAQQHILAAYTLNNPCVIRFEPPLIVAREHPRSCVPIRRSRG